LIFARKRFGQHFLHDRSVLDRIVREVAPTPRRRWSRSARARRAHRTPDRACRTLDAIEIDRDLAEQLRARWGAPQASSCTWPMRSNSTSRRWRACAATLRVIGNLPYNISTPLLFHIAAAHENIDDLHVMLQEGSHRRIAARNPVPSPTAASPSMLAPWFETRHLLDVGPGAFTPPRASGPPSRASPCAGKPGLRGATPRWRARCRRPSPSAVRRCEMGLASLLGARGSIARASIRP
jgi:16S rRNA (adenine1518-N6/adenine1519-N6)-dimethyltransferase